ncbi:hypothetical protein LJ739_10860 [Aestuariibacter halophilus]|uniref:HD-GYP domain-containing protein n=1 Tax=Fluctibacter halophilus TaxID=226011 RepID=A0ABS8G834_9ALTE|nr:HD domain-containing phosphohydrolase [Aestuariibacter halophilus]MCC2616742.1 hypothetical protein [Aestuariibacter halophilus]
MPKAHTVGLNQANVVCISANADTQNWITASFAGTGVTLSVCAPDEQDRLAQQLNTDVAIVDLGTDPTAMLTPLCTLNTLLPHCFVIGLVHGDQAAPLIKVVNQCDLDRFVPLPNKAAVLLKHVANGVQNARLKRENERLETLVHKQNHQLKSMALDLRDKVLQRSRQLYSSLTQLQQHQRAFEQMLYNFISIDPYLDGKRAKDISYTAQQVAKRLGLSDGQIEQLRLAAVLGEIGKLGLDVPLLKRPFNKLTYQQQQGFYAQIQHAEMILSPASHLDDVKAIIRHQFEQVSGSGYPDKLRGKAIPIGARILAAVRDYYWYATGEMTGNKMPHRAIKLEMRQFERLKYDPQVLKALFSQLAEKPRHLDEYALTTDELKPGMVLKSNLYNDEHILVLSEGTVLTEVNIARLKGIEAKHTGLLVLDIRKPETACEAVDSDNETASSSSVQDLSTETPVTA